MNPDHFLTLLRLELGRLAPLLRRLSLSTAVIALIFFGLGLRSPEDQLTVALGTAVGFVLAGPIAMGRDKFEGTLELLCTLPATAGVITAAKFVASAVAAAPGALLSASALSQLVRASWGSWQLLALFPLLWGAFALASWLLVAIVARFEPETLAAGPAFVVSLLLIATPAIIERLFPSAWSAIRALFSWHWSPSGTVTCVLLLAILLAVGAFTIARAGIASYRR